MPVFRRPRFVGLFLAVALASGCDSGQPPTAPTAAPPAVSSPAPAPEAPPPTPPPAQPSPPAFPRYRVSGRVTNDAGVPVPNAPLSLDYGRREAAPISPTCHPGACWLNAEADAGGFYAFDLEPGTWRGGWQIGGLGYLYSLHPDYETNVQVVPDGANTVVLNMKLRRIRQVAAGQETMLEVAPDSTRCTDLENWWLADMRCEVVRVVADRPGTLLVTARNAGMGQVPGMFAHTSGNYGSGSWRIEPGILSIPVLGGTYFIFIGMPDGTGPQRVEVTTSLQ